ncbi:MAG: LysR family transcriptional regulator [Blastocatellia bacterium]
MEFRQLKTFLAIAETRNFTRAAERVHLTQAAVSAQIKALEAEAGVPLFARVNKKVFLTEAGELLVRRAERLLKAHDEALLALKELGEAETGRLRIGTASTMASNDLLPAILAELKREYPRAQITVRRATSTDIVAQILQNDLDVGLVSLPVEASDIRAEVLQRDRLVAIMQPAHPLAHQRSISPLQLAAEPLIMGEQGGNTRRLIDLFFAKSGVRPEVIMELGSMTSIKRMVEHGLGLSLVPRSSVREEIKAGTLIVLPVRGFKDYWELGLVSLKSAHVPPLQQAFKKLCEKHFE